MSTTPTKAAPPAKSGQGVAASTQTPAPRTRAGMSMARRLAIALAGVIAIASRPEVGKIIKAEDVETIKNAKALADEANAKTLAPIDARLKELQGEIQAAATPEALAKITAMQTLKTLTQEMARLQNRRKAIVASAG